MKCRIYISQFYESDINCITAKLTSFKITFTILMNLNAIPELFGYLKIQHVT